MPHVMISSKKCTGCHMCELACSAWHEGAYRPSVARLSVKVNPSAITVKGSTCLQTGCAKCEEACPIGAIRRKQIAVHDPTLAQDGSTAEAVAGYVLVVDEDACNNCGMCYDVCPHGVIFEHPEKQVATKCDLCQGSPQCISFCQNPHVLAIGLKLSKADRELAATAG